jgi:hypothetical protein
VDDIFQLLMELSSQQGGQRQPTESQYAHKYSLSEPTESARQKLGISQGAIAEMIPRWRELQQGAGNSSNFQRELYEAWSGRAAPENYTGFHASQIDRLGNVFSPQDVDLDLMREIAVIATALRELDETGYNNDFAHQFQSWSR